MDRGHLERAARQCPGLIKNNSFRLSKRLQIVAAFHKNAAFGRAADTAKKAERYRNNQCARAGNDQKRKRARHPDTEHPHTKQRREHSQQHGADHDGRRVVTREFGNKVFRLCFFRTGIFYKIQNLGDGGFSKFLCNTYTQQAALIHTAADDVTACAHIPRQRFACERRCINSGISVQNYTVQWDAFSCFDNDGVTHRHVVRVNLFQFAVTFNIGVIGPDVHQSCNGLTRTPHRIALEQLTHLIKQHDLYRFGKFLQTKSANSCQCHQKIFIKYLPVSDIPYGFPHDVPPDDCVDRKIKDEL